MAYASQFFCNDASTATVCTAETTASVATGCHEWAVASEYAAGNVSEYATKYVSRGTAP